MSESAFDNEQSAKYTVTLKGGAGYESPWIVVRSNDVPGLKSDIGALDDEALSIVKATGQRFSGAGDPPSTVGSAAQQFANAGMVGQSQVTDAYAADAAQGGPGAFAAPEVAPPAPPAPAAGAHVCKHGPRVFKSGVNKQTQKPWSGWMCNTPRGTADQCSPEWGS